jgi:hypothetical protein
MEVLITKTLRGMVAWTNWRNQAFTLVTLQQPRLKGTSLALVPRLIVLPEEADGKPLGPNSRVLLLRRKRWAGCKSANIRQVLLKFILGLTFHSSPNKKRNVSTTIVSSLLYRLDSCWFDNLPNVSARTEARIRKLMSEALAATSDSEVERILPELRSALQEHIRLAKESLEAQVVTLEGPLSEMT